jgi:hypothetical protein
LGRFLWVRSATVPIRALAPYCVPFFNWLITRKQRHVPIGIALQARPDLRISVGIAVRAQHTDQERDNQ